MTRPGVSRLEDRFVVLVALLRAMSTPFSAEYQHDDDGGENDQQHTHPNLRHRHDRPSIITDQRGHVTTAAERSIMRRLLRENSLSIVMFGLFLVFLVMQSLTGWRTSNQELVERTP